MSIHLIGILALALVFVIGTLTPVNIGALALVATFLIGTLVAGEKVNDLLKGFPPDLFVLLVGVTYLFGLAAVNGTIKWLVERTAGLLGDRPAMVPWLVFGFSAIPTTLGALGPASVAMLAPIAFQLAERYKIDRRLIALMVMHGVGLGNFSPLNGLAVIVNHAADANNLQISALGLFLGNAAYNIGLAVVIYFLFGGRELLRANQAAGAAAVFQPVVEKPEPLRTDQTLTLVAIVAVAIGALGFSLNIGFLSLIAACALHLMFPKRVEGADKRIVWSVVLLICGVVTLMGALQRYGTVDLVGTSIAGLGAPLLTAFLLCLVAAVTSAFGSSAGLLGVLIPISVPFLAQGHVGVTGMLVALAVSATVVDATPFSSVGALIVAGSDEADRQKVFRTMLLWGLAMAITAPILTWLFFILPNLR